MRASFYFTRRRLVLSTDGKAQRFASPMHLTWRRGTGVARCRMTPNSSEDSSEFTTIPDTIPHTSANADWRTYRAQLVATSPQSAKRRSMEWAHPLPAPELGSVLVAHPLMFTEQQTYFHMAVIFIFVHDHTGSAGLILNKPTRYAFGDLDISNEVTAGFEENPLYLGGDVGDESLNLLHRFKDLEKSIEVVEGVYLNGFDAAQQAVLRGNKKPSDFKWYARFCGWNPGQLEEECRNGVWFPAACGSEMILTAQDQLEGPADLWHQVLQLMGGEYKELSDTVIESSIKNSPNDGQTKG